MKKRTLEGWGKRYGLEILDPDGFDRIDGHLMSRRFTMEEFARGIGSCTVRWGLGNKRKQRRFEHLMAIRFPLQTVFGSQGFFRSQKFRHHHKEQ